MTQLSQEVREKFDREGAQRWLDALRSGDYVQGRNALRRANNTFCCLGVACDVLFPNRWKLDPSEVYVFTSMNGEVMWGTLSHELIGALALSFAGSRLDGKDHAFTDSWAISTLTAANDDYGKTFNEIADAVEAYYKEHELL